MEESHRCERCEGQSASSSLSVKSDGDDTVLHGETDEEVDGEGGIGRECAGEEPS